MATPESTQTHFNRIKGAAKSGYNQALRHITPNEPAIQVGQLGRGYVIQGAISQFIRTGSEHVTGKKPDRSTVEYARKFLRLSKNMVATQQVDTYTFKIFVREHWVDYDNVMPLVYEKSNRSEDWYERSLSPEEAGEYQPIEEVSIKKLPFLCPHCSYGAETKEILQSHMAEQHEGQPMYVCKHCGRKFDTCQKLGGHVTGHHTYKKDSKSQPKKTNKSPRHETKVDIPELAWKATNQWDESRERFVCPLCDRDFRTWNALARHKEWHVNDWARDILTKSSGEPSALTDDQLLEELKGRMGNKDQEKELATLKERHDFIRSIIEDVNSGKTAPLKGLSDIEAALDL